MAYWQQLKDVLEQLQEEHGQTKDTPSCYMTQGSEESKSEVRLAEQAMLVELGQLEQAVLVQAGLVQAGLVQAGLVQAGLVQAVLELVEQEQGS